MPPQSTANAALSVVVETRRRLTPDIVELVLTPPGGSALPTWAPGAHIDVDVPGIGPRQYSLCSSPADNDRFRIAVLREIDGRGGSITLHESVVVGDELRISMPRNNFALADADRHVFVAGGIGITPLLPMIADLASRDSEWELHYGGRSEESMAYLDELRDHGARVHVRPQDRLGPLPVADILADAGPGTRVYCCGPAGLIAAVEDRAGPDVAVHTERFTPKQIVEDDGARAFTVCLASSGLTVDVGADQSILDALEAVGVSPVTSCREGTCASCETGVLEGEIVHRDSVLTAAERQAGRSMMVCVSRAASERLVLDL